MPHLQHIKRQNSCVNPEEELFQWFIISGKMNIFTVSYTFFRAKIVLDVGMDTQPTHHANVTWLGYDTIYGTWLDGTPLNYTNFVTGYDFSKIDNTDYCIIVSNLPL